MRGFIYISATDRFKAAWNALLKIFGEGEINESEKTKSAELYLWYSWALRSLCTHIRKPTLFDVGIHLMVSRTVKFLRFRNYEILSECLKYIEVAKVIIIIGLF